MQACSDAAALAGTSGKKLMVVLDWQSLGLPAKEMQRVNEQVLDAIQQGLGRSWARQLYRIYFGGRDREAKAWREHYRSEHLIAQWRAPNHKGRRAPSDWDFRIRQNALDWCVNDPEAAPERTTFVLVSNCGDFGRLIEKLDEAGVRVRLIHTDSPNTECQLAFGQKRMLKVCV